MNEHAEEQRRQLHPPRGLKGHRSGPVREVWVDRSGPEMQSQPGMREQVNQADSDGMDRCVWMMFELCVCVCVLDAVRIGTSLILHLNALLGHSTPPSSLLRDVRITLCSLY